MLCAVILGLLAQLTNTASLEGVVARLGTGEPLARATVTLARDRSPFQVLSTTTDASGRFSFPNVSPGEYRLQASHQGPYIPAEYGQRKRGERGIPITIQPGQKITEIRLELAPTGSISGRILDRDGEPLGRAEVQALQSFYQDGHRGLYPVQTVMTNDLGEYRLRLLQPGRYWIRARVLNPQEAQGQLSIRPPAATAPFFLSRSTVIPYVSRRALDNGAIEEYLEAPVYFPGVIDPGLATPLELGVGENPGGFDFTTASGHLPAQRIRGKIINSGTGQPAGRNAAIVVVPRTPDSLVFTAAAQSVDDGSFEIKGVTSGSYFLFATLYPAGSIGNPFVYSGIASARISIDVGDKDLENLPVVVVPNFKIPVRLVFEGETSDPSSTLKGNVQLFRDLPIGFGGSQAMKFIAGAVGEIEGIGPGDYRISRSGPGYIQSARLGSADVLKDGLHLDHQPEGFLEVVIAETTASVEGRVTDGTQAVSNAVVVLVPPLNLRQRSNLYYVVATDGNGHFQIQPRIVPGDYKVFAWKDIEQGAWQDPEVLERYENQGQPVSVNSDSKLNIDVRLVR